MNTGAEPALTDRSPPTHRRYPAAREGNLLRPRWYASLMFQAVCLQAAFFAVRPMVSYRVLELGAGPLALGVMAASFSLLPLILAVVIGRFTDRIGSSRVIAAGVCTTLTGSGLSIAAQNVTLLVVASAVIGLGHLTCLVAQQTLVAEATTSDSRDRAFGGLTAFASLGQVIGPLAAAMAAAGGVFTTSAGGTNARIGLAVAAAFTAIALPLCLPLRAVGARPATRPLEPTHSVIRDVLRTDGMWQAMLASGAVLASLDLLLAFLPLWANDRGVSVTVVGWLLALRAAVTVAVRLGYAPLVERCGRRVVLIGSIAMAAAAFVLLPWTGPAGAVAVMAMFGIGLGLAQPLTISWVVARATPDTRGSALGLRITANRLAQFVVPAMVGVLAGGAGSTGVFLASAALLSCTCGAIARAPLEDGPP
jgi:MFS family permease